MLRIDLYTDIKNIDADTKKINEVIENNFSGEPEIEIVINLDRVVESKDVKELDENGHLIFPDYRKEDKSHMEINDKGLYMDGELVVKNESDMEAIRSYINEHDDGRQEFK